MMNAWYLVDGTLCGSLTDLSSALGIIESEDPSYGLLLIRSKCLLYSLLGTPIDYLLPADILVPSCNSVGPPSYCEKSLL